MRSEFVACIDDFPVAAVADWSLHPHFRKAHAIVGKPLSATEKALLQYFRRHAGRTLSRDELAEQVWKQRYYYGSRAIDQTVAKLRKKLRAGDGTILSVYAIGYRFEDGSIAKAVDRR